MTLQTFLGIGFFGCIGIFLLIVGIDDEREERRRLLRVLGIALLVTVFCVLPFVDLP